ncbi:MAG: PH domain-containing protein [bacterium]
MEEFELEPGERITLSVRKHWIVFAIELIPYALLALAPLLIPEAINLIASVQPAGAHFLTQTAGFEGPWARFGLGVWWFFLWIGAFNVFTRYFLDVWVITTERVVDIHQFGFFRREVSSFLLAHIQDVTTNVNGILPTLFGFGTIHVETAGHDELFLMHGIRDPQGLRDLIMHEIADLHLREGQKLES